MQRFSAQIFLLCKKVWQQTVSGPQNFLLANVAMPFRSIEKLSVDAVAGNTLDLCTERNLQQILVTTMIEVTSGQCSKSKISSRYHCYS